MRIDRLELRNFRCFTERTFDFQPQFNVLIGENATGKTAILEARAITAGSWLLGFGGQKRRQTRTDDARLIGRSLGGETTFESQFPVEIKVDGWLDDERLQWRRTLKRES